MNKELLESLAEASESTPEQIEADIQTLMRSYNYEEPAAIVKWKSDHSLQMGRGKPQTLKLRIVARQTPRTANTQDGQSSVANVAAIYKDESGQVGFGQATLWGDRAEQANKVRIGETWTGIARIQEGTQQTLLRALDIKDKAADTDVPTLSQMEESGWEFGKLEAVQDYAGTEEVFKGMVGKQIQSNDGAGRVMGLEISNPFDASMPLALWAGSGPQRPPVEEVQELLNSAKVGEWIYAYAYVNQKADGTISLNSNGILRA